MGQRGQQQTAALRLGHISHPLWCTQGGQLPACQCPTQPDTGAHLVQRCPKETRAVLGRSDTVSDPRGDADLC